jgi:hypothetical protein
MGRGKAGRIERGTAARGGTRGRSGPPARSSSGDWAGRAWPMRPPSPSRTRSRARCPHERWRVAPGAAVARENAVHAVPRALGV